MLKIAIGTDHAGYELKEVLKAQLIEKGHEVDDFGTDGPESVDYPDFIRPAAESVAAGENDIGIVLGGSDNGEAIVANKVAGIRCGLCWNEVSARLTKEHNNANVISIGARMVTPEMAEVIVDTWLSTVYEGGRHQARLDKIE
ncbi:MAG: ribose 5-phosphate isomerase B [Opitutales bacterium]|nr:ribose 5-phosphate isomerase B [Opitutales bacterium]